MPNANKFWVAIVSPVIAAVLPFVTDGWQPADAGPIIVAVLIALGVYSVPNTAKSTTSDRSSRYQ